MAICGNGRYLVQFPHRHRSINWYLQKGRLFPDSRCQEACKACICTLDCLGPREAVSTGTSISDFVIHFSSLGIKPVYICYHYKCLFFLKLWTYNFWMQFQNKLCIKVRSLLKWLTQVVNSLKYYQSANMSFLAQQLTHGKPSVFIGFFCWNLIELLSVDKAWVSLVERIVV